MLYGDRHIRRMVDAAYRGEDRIVIFPYPDDHQFQPASVDLRLGALLRSDGKWSRYYWLEAGQFVLGSTAEMVGMPNTAVGQVCGKSTLARRGLLVECAGLIDPGFEGQITLELKNLSHERIRLEHNMLICQISFMPVLGGVDRPYGSAGVRSHYQGQRGPTPARD